MNIKRMHALLAPKMKEMNINERKKSKNELGQTSIFKENEPSEYLIEKNVKLNFDYYRPLKH